MAQFEGKKPSQTSLVQKSSGIQKSCSHEDATASSNSACWKPGREISALEQVGISVQISVNSLHSEEICSLLQLQPPPWKSRFSAPANLSQATRTEKFCGFLSPKNLYGRQVLDLTSLGWLSWARAKKNPSQLVLAAFPALEQVCAVLKTYQAHL